MTTDSNRRGYVIAVDKITDMDRFADEYLPTTAETIGAHDGEVLVGSFEPDVREGEWDPTGTFVVEFPTVEAANEWYNDETYQDVVPIRHDTCEYTNLIVTPEFRPEVLE
ncbi:DUF1330 domain-containing protein [Natronococcus wangiae]|uniref:DUF1330 domain-containing protein n=1 Tax=Natronococcus wangiae TaxID=3068275 RepID=UPI00273D65D5|nr:DUF1330 domain-containing protein [Natronococcus sp. AD5]